MSDISPEVAFRITQTGAQGVKQSLQDIDQQLNQTTASTERHGKSVSKLTQFYKEERAEHRQANFLFKETRDVVSTAMFAMVALSAANDGASQSTKKITKSMTEAFGSFMAADFAIKGLRLATGGTATAISAVVGIGVGLLSFLDRDKEKADAAAEAHRRLNESLHDFNEGIGKDRAQRELDVFTKKLADEQKELARLSSTFTTSKSFGGQFGGTVTRTETVGTTEQIKHQQGLVDAYKNEIEQLRIIVELETQRDLVQKRQTGAAQEKFNAWFTPEDRKHLYNPTLTYTDDSGTMGDSDVSLGQPRLTKGRKAFNDTIKQLSTVKKTTKELNQEERLFLGTIAQSFNDIGSIMDYLGVRTDTFVGKLVGGLREAVTFAQLLNNVLTLFGGGPLGVLGFLGMGSTTKTVGTTLSGGDLSGLNMGSANKTIPPGLRKSTIAMLQDAERKGKV